MPPCHRPHVTLRAAAIRLEFSDATAYAAAAYLTQYTAAAAAAGPTSSDEQGRVGACLFVASKVCEQPRRARDVVNAVHRAVHGGLLRSSHEYWAKKESLLSHEQGLLRGLGFDLTVAHPHPFFYHYCHALDAPPQLAALAAAILNDSACSAECGDTPAGVVAAAALALAAALLHPSLAPRSLPERWWDALGVSDARLAETCAHLGRVYGAAGQQAAGRPAEEGAATAAGVGR